MSDTVHHRSPRRVLDDHLAALNSGDADRIAADYADDAVVLLPGKAVTGKAAIRDAFADNARTLPGAAYAPLSVTEATGLLLLEWGMKADSLTVTDGIDTFLVSDGLIRRQTSRFTVMGQ
ncbi:nuclear transport factor 2 family protein [Streptomyces sp. ISL-12]|uniref:nuclear transport factor 2 family protein n=1 Tax=Streptomyces sp. ISL-12 TaxID=2819177 RepID=UPI001BE7BE26|nr:nuclear transport factor 2 family protein [Streptomyces sp. ISL-12]MBT2412785.1 nuclear transport factor 2 family protein [Streptomyces sp. ISL-12]